jgi:hypothetical protein
MIDKRIRLLAQRIHDEKPDTARAQRMIANLFAEMCGFGSSDQDRAESGARPYSWKELRQSRVEGVTTLNDQWFNWGDRSPAQAMFDARFHLIRLISMGKHCNCRACRELNTSTEVVGTALGAYTGPIEPGMRFMWQPLTPDMYCEIVVTRVVARDDERVIWSSATWPYSQQYRTEIPNEEWRFRESVMPYRPVSSGN